MLAFLKKVGAGAMGMIALCWPFAGSGATTNTSNALPHSIKVVMDDNYPPYAFRDSDGNLRGILVDVWERWSRKTGIKVETQGMVWFSALRRMEKGEFDVIDTIFLTERRARSFDFTKPYVNIEVPAFFHRDISGIRDAESLRGFTVAVKESDTIADILKNAGVTNLIVMHSYEEIVNAAEEGRVSVFAMDKPPALYFLYKKGLQDRFRMSPPLSGGQFHRAVKKGRKELLEVVERGFAMIPQAELDEIEQHWSGIHAPRMAYLRHVGVGLGVILGLVLALLVWNRTLRKAVRDQTSRLQKEIAVSHEREQALQESEQRFRLFMDQLPGLAYIKDGSLRTVMVSQNFEKFLGRPLAELLGKNNDELFPEIAEKLNQDDRRILDLPFGEHAVMEESFRGRTFLTYKFPLPIKGQKMIGGFTVDITDRKQAEESRLKLEAQVQQTQKLESLGLLAGGIAHDFNNLLMAILGNIDLTLSDLPATSAARVPLSDAASASRRAAELCRQMLAYAGKARFVVERLDLNRVVLDMVNMIEVSISKSVFLKWALAEGLPPVSADATQFRQIIMNLVINASEAIGSKEGTITITTGTMLCEADDLVDPWAEAPLPAGRYVFFEVADTGCGMPRETLPRIFDPFFTTKFTGRGLGLAAVLGIVRGHHGLIKVTSEPGRGSAFRVLLPATPDAVEKQPKPAQPMTFRGSGKILLVDDEPAVRLTARRMLERFGFTVVEADDGLRAVEEFRRDPRGFTLVLLDLTMPRMDGERAFEEMRLIHPDPPVVLSSGFDAHDVTQRFTAQGLRGFIQKPYTQESLASLLASAVR